MQVLDWGIYVVANKTRVFDKGKKGDRFSFVIYNCLAFKWNNN